MAGQEPIGRVMMGPYLAVRVRRIGSISEMGLRSHSKLPTKGIAFGPGGRLSFGKMKSLRDFSKAAIQREMTMMKTHVSIFVTEWRRR